MSPSVSLGVSTTMRAAAACEDSAGGGTARPMCRGRPRCCHSIRLGLCDSDADGRVLWHPRMGGHRATHPQGASMRAIFGTLGIILLLGLGAEPSAAQSTPQPADPYYLPGE